MKKPLPIFFLLLCFTTFSCKDDKESPPRARLSSISVTFNSDQNYSYTFSYDKHGLLYGYKQSGSGGINTQITHHYDGSKRLIGLDLLNQGSGSNIKHAFIYDRTGRLSSGTLKYPASSSPVETWPPHYLTFLNDGLGRLARINSTNDPGKTGIAITLAYDGAGNVIRELKHSISPTGELYQPFSNIKIIYDNKKNPFQRLGSPFFTYGFPFSLVPSYIFYLSPNNPVKVEMLDERGATSRVISFNYTYTKEDFPSEVTIGGSTQQFNYEIK